MVRCLVAVSLSLCIANTSATGQGFYQREPIRYSRAADENVITALNLRIAAGEVELALESKSGRLRALLRALAVPESSQTLVFSKTSLQRHRVSPSNPRALFFGPDVYVGWVPGAAAIEVAAGDAKLGLVFYSLSQDPEQAPQLRRDDSCLSCHATSRTDDEPGLLLRSVFPDENGDPIASAGETAVTLSAPIEERWGGWLVTGHFEGVHRGNGIASRDERGHWLVQGRAAADLQAFAEDFAVEDYPVATSDIGALLALEQQVTVHNVLIQCTLQMRCLLENDRALNDLLGETGQREPTADIGETLAKKIAVVLLLGGEASLEGRDAAPSAAFAADFVAPWPKDPSGVRLGRLDLRQRLFDLPMSPMVHSPAFAALPVELRNRVLARLRLVLASGRIPGGVELTPEQRRVLHVHLRSTLTGY
ncbi:MAG: hypothetical protein ABIP94_17625 [Planctomycetota bacterium]